MKASAVIVTGATQTQEPPRRGEPPASTYQCTQCEARWSYPDVQNTGRCPACGGGLLRDVVVGGRV